MRYVPVSLLKEGMAIGQDIFDGAGRMLLAKHLVLTEEYIEDLDDLGFPGIYIDDEFSEGIEIKEVLRPEIIREALSLVSNMFLSNKDEVATEIGINKVVMDIVTGVLDNGDVMCNMRDIKKYDDYLYFHSVNVGVISAMVGAALKLPEALLRDLTTAAMLHDVGKRFLPIEVINHEKELNEEELKVYKTHSKQGADYVRDRFTFSVYVIQGILQHHEWYNGDGYPLGRIENDIPIIARIIGVVDTYDVLTSDRPHRPAYSNAEAMEYIMGLSGRRFDPQIIEAFMHKIAIYPEGSLIELSDGRTAIVVKNNKEAVLRPVIRIIPSKEEINLMEEGFNITITKMVM